jgi:hypothetical protein
MVEPLHNKVLRDIFSGGQFIGMEEFWSFRKGMMVFYRGTSPEDRGIYQIVDKSYMGGERFVAEGGFQDSTQIRDIHHSIIEERLCVPLPTYYYKPVDHIPVLEPVKLMTLHLNKMEIMKVSAYDDVDMVYNGYIGRTPVFRRVMETLSPSSFFPIEDPVIQSYLHESFMHAVYDRNGRRITYNFSRDCFRAENHDIANPKGVMVCLNPDQQFLFDLLKDWGRSPASCGYSVSRDDGVSWTSPVMIQTWGGVIDEFLIGEVHYKDTNSFEGHPLTLSLEQTYRREKK